MNQVPVGPTEKPAFTIKTVYKPICPQCGSERLYKDGLRYLVNGESVQRYQCRDCGYRFSWPKKESQHKSKNLKNEHDLTFNECSSRALAFLEQSVEGAMNRQAENGQWAAGATTQTQQFNVDAKLLEFSWWMKKEGYKELTIIGKIKRLKRLVKLGANLLDPESVKEVIAKQNWNDSSKETTSYAYDLFARWMGIPWERPRYKAQRKFPFLPNEQEINDLIASCNKIVACFLQILKETAARPGEVFNLKWIDVDLENKTMVISPEKGSNPRIFKISSKLVSMLSNLPKRGERIFANYSSLKALTVSFQKQRRKAVYTFGNPRLLRISFRTLRHWRATMEYARTKDILHVMEMLGHRNIKNTLIYTQLIKAQSEDEYICKVAKTVEQAAALIEAGFDYVCEIDGVKLFRKRK